MPAQSRDRSNASAEMNHQDVPFALPRTIAPNLRRVRDYWAGLKRGGNNIPFGDDLHLTVLSDVAAQLIVIDVFAKPPRFRLSIVGESWHDEARNDVVGRFLDEIQATPCLVFLQSQCVATLESGKPTWYAQHVRSQGSTRRTVYERLLLPMWSDGRISLILGAIDRHSVPSIHL
jgi:hypothetical protein